MTTRQILLVDNDEPFLQTVAGVFEDREFHVTAVTDGRIAIARIAMLEHLRLVLTDLEMPNMSGTDVLRIVRETRPTVQRALMSARIGVEAEFDAALQAQCEPHVLIRKPIALKILTDLIERLRFGG